MLTLTGYSDEVGYNIPIHLASYTSRGAALHFKVHLALGNQVNEVDEENITSPL